MHHLEDQKPISELKRRAAELVDTVTESRRPLIITRRGESKAVLMDIRSYRELRDGALLLKLIAMAEADKNAGRVDSTRSAMRQAREAATAEAP